MTADRRSTVVLRRSDQLAQVCADVHGTRSAEIASQCVEELLKVGVNAGDRCHHALAGLLQADAIIDEADLAGSTVYETDVLVIGGGGAGCAAALVAAEHGARVILATKLRLGDSNTVMAEGGIQASI